MMKRRISYVFSAVILSFCFLLSACSPAALAPPVISGNSGESAASTDAGSFEDVKTVDTSALTPPDGMDEANAVSFAFSDSGITADGTDGFEVDGTALKIQSSGTYCLSGACADGSVTVAKETAGVYLIFDGLSLSSSSGPALTCNKSSSVFLYLAEGSENFLSDPETEHEEGAALKCKAGSAFTLGGGGSLTVTGNSKNGVKGGAGAVLQILSGRLSVTAENNALACDHYLQIDGGTLQLSAKNDGIKSSPDADDTVSAGNLTFHGGNITVSAVGDGIAADGLLSVTGGTFEIITTGEITPSSGNSFGFGGGFGMWGPGGGSSASASDDASSKGIKAGTAMKISGGQITVSSTDHALYCKGETVIDGGNLSLSSSASKGIKTEGDLTVSGDATQIRILKATEGIESRSAFTLNGGTVIIENASDDGVNMGGSVSSADAEAHALTVNGGTLKISARGDGLDSNGAFHMKGGTVVVFGPSNGGNSCLDIQYLSSFEGGTLLGAAASSSMWNEVVGHTAGEYLYTLSGGSLSGNSTVEVLDGDGKVLLSENCSLSGNIGLYFMTDKTEDLSSCTFRIDGRTVTPQTGNSTGSSGGMGGMGGGFGPGGFPPGDGPGGGFPSGGGDHGGGPGGRR